MGYERMVKATRSGNLSWLPTEQAAIDQVAAIGFASKKDKVGSKILRMEALDVKSTQQVILLTARRLKIRHKIELKYARKVAIAVLHEFLCPNCFYCGGKGETHEANSIVTECPHCNGTGMHRYSNQQREVLLGGRTYNQKVYEDALNYVRDTARAIVGRAEKRLDDAVISSAQPPSVETTPKTQGASDDGN